LAAGIDYYEKFGKLVEFTADELVVVPYGFIGVPLCVKYCVGDARKLAKGAKKELDPEMLGIGFMMLTVYAPEYVKANVNVRDWTAIKNLNLTYLRAKSGTKEFKHKASCFETFCTACEA
jgi:hypothetical protein